MNTFEEILLVNGEHMGWGDSTNRAGANFLFKKGHLAKEIVGAHFPQSQFPSICLGYGFDLALLNDVHTIARICLTDDNFPVFILLPQTGHVVILTLVIRMAA